MSAYEEGQISLAHGAETWYFEDWIDAKHKGVVICSCNDGLRPVIIKIGRTDEDETFEKFCSH